MIPWYLVSHDWSSWFSYDTWYQIQVGLTSYNLVVPGTRVVGYCGILVTVYSRPYTGTSTRYESSPSTSRAISIPARVHGSTSISTDTYYLVKPVIGSTCTGISRALRSLVKWEQGRNLCSDAYAYLYGKVLYQRAGSTCTGIGSR